jgi:hypothetical protein
MLRLPQRRAFASREDFVAAVTCSFDELRAIYDAEPVLTASPDWTRDGAGVWIFHVSLPLKYAREGGEAFGLSNLVKHMIERGKSIKRMARVETAKDWLVWVETD